MKEVVSIFGAGLSGLVAATELAERGYPVIVHDKLRIPGGLAAARPSVHSVLLDPGRACRYLDLPLADRFTPVRREVLYVEGRRMALTPRHYNCTRGRVSSSLDIFLLEVAESRGAKLRWRSPYRPEASRHGPVIVATGLATQPFAQLGIASDAVYGYTAFEPWDGEAILLTYRSGYTFPDYGYVASRDGLVSACLFSRHRPLDPPALERFKTDLWETERLEFPDWKPLRAEIPRGPVGAVSGTLLAGTLAGMIDPFYLSGLSGALVSGRIAAVAVADPGAANREFDRMPRTYRAKAVLRAAAAHPHTPRAVRAATVFANHVVPMVGGLRSAGARPR